MKKTLLLIKTTLFLTLFGATNSFAQYVDVTEQYIPNAGFEECEALPVVVYHDNQKDIDINKIEVWSHWNTAKGTDYESTGWKLVEQMKNANGGVVVYGVNIQSGQYATAGEPGPAQGITGTKGLCFCGAAGLIYQQADEITLPAGAYRLTVNLYARNGQTTNPGPTQQVNNIKTGFMPTGGTEDDLIPAKRASKQFTSNAWDTEVLDIELTQPTKGRFQISYGSSYFVVVDDVKLEYQGGVVTTALATAITKAKALNAELESSDLTTAIGNAEAFIANPTTQDDVTTQTETLYNAMATALTQATKVVNITAAYLENSSFETGKIDPWTWGTAIGNVCELTNLDSQPFIDGKNIVEFTLQGTNAVSQTMTHLPAGYYAIDAKLNQKAFLKIGSNSTLLQGGSDFFYSRVHPAIYNATAAGDLTIGAQASTAYRVDNFRIFYGKDEASLLAELLKNVKIDAQAILDLADYQVVIGKERTDLGNAINGTDIDAINEAANVFVNARRNYKDLADAKTKAAPYTVINYPYAKQELLEQIQTLINTDATSAANATQMTTELENACKAVVVSNAYCEGVSNTEYTSSIVASNASGTTINSAWTANNVTIRTLTSGKALINPKTEAKDQTVYGTTESYNSNNANLTASLQQTIKNLPAGDYVFACNMMAKSNLPVDILINGTVSGTFTGEGTATSSGWKNVVVSFEKKDANDLTLCFNEAASVTFKEWYVDNMRLYLLSGETGIHSVKNSQNTNHVFYNLAGQRVEQPAKGLYIINGKKVVIK